jgi:hypothetical protein
MLILLKRWEARQNGLEGPRECRITWRTRGYAGLPPSRWCTVLLLPAECGPVEQSFRTMLPCWRHTLKLLAGSCGHVSAIQGHFDETFFRFHAGQLAVWVG